MFVNESLQLWGRVPVTQLQVEIHVNQRLSRPHGITRNLTEHYAQHGLHKFGPGEQVTEGWQAWNNPHSVAVDRAAVGMLSALYAAGFVTFHIDFAGD